MFEKIKVYLKNFIETRNVAFYIALGVAVLTMIFGIVATAALGVAGATGKAVAFTVAGFVLFLVFSLLKLEWAGAASVALGGGAALVAAVCDCFSYFVNAFMELGMTGINMTAIMAINGIGAAIASIVGLLLCAIAANVFVYIRLKKKPVEKEEIYMENNENIAEEVK